MIFTILQILISVLFLFSFFSHSEKKTVDWRENYINQEKTRITTIEKAYIFHSPNYELEYIDTTSVTFDMKNQKIGENNRIFYKYNNDGKIKEVEYCGRDCKYPLKDIYYYDSLNRLKKITYVTSRKKEILISQYFYNDKNLLIKEVWGNDSTSTTQTYSYDNLNRLSCKSTKEFITHLNKWETVLDSMFYDFSNNIILSKRYHIGKDLMTISKFIFQYKLLITKIDTTITKEESYLPTPNTFHNAYFFREDYKYNKENKIIEIITTQPDYITPIYKRTYEYIYRSNK